MTTGKQKGYVLYDEVNDLLAEDYPGGRELDDLLTELDTAGVEILEEPKLEFDKKAEEAEEPGELDLVQEINDKTNDPVRMYLREMGSVPLLTREGEIELAKRIERGQAAVRKAISRSALVINEILAMPQLLREDPRDVRDVLVMPDLVVAEETFRSGPKSCSPPSTKSIRTIARPSIPPEVAGRLARHEAQDAPYAALEFGAHSGGDLAPDPRHTIYFSYPALTS